MISTLILVDFPHNSTMLTEKERALAVQRIMQDSGQNDIEGANGERPWDGVKQCFSDPLIYLFTLCLTSCVIGVAFNQ